MESTLPLGLQGELNMIKRVRSFTAAAMRAMGGFQFSSKVECTITGVPPHRRTCSE